MKLGIYLQAFLKYRRVHSENAQRVLIIKINYVAGRGRLSGRKFQHPRNMLNVIANSH